MIDIDVKMRWRREGNVQLYGEVDTEEQEQAQEQEQDKLHVNKANDKV